MDVKELGAKNKHTGKMVVNNVSLQVCSGEIVCIAGIDENGQSELVYALTGLLPADSGTLFLDGKDLTHSTIRERTTSGMGCIPEDRHKHGLLLDYNLAYNLVLQSYFSPQFQRHGFLKYEEIYRYSQELIQKFDIRSAQGSKTLVRSMSGGNQQKAV